MITPEQARDYKTRLHHWTNNYDDFLELKSKELANKIFVDAIELEMRNHNFSEKLWQNTEVSNVEIDTHRIRIIITNEYFTDTGFDVAVARERGTRDHWIRPRVKLVLSWIKGGKRLFSRGHIVSGIQSLFIIRNTIKNKMPEFETELKREFDNWKIASMK